ncbi:MAG: pimeloyl-CoA dehydrogenase small subunit [Betaproteobacteria bacterium]|nr:pimeloyl-CoA dehydrogenase small subunit [Betaproteobacteria bacterium]
MNFDSNETQQLLADAVLRFAAKDYDFEARKRIVQSADGWSESVWNTIAEMGLLGIPFSADYGGFGGGAADLMNVMDAIGSALIVEPFLPTVGLGAQLVARAGSAAQHAAILPSVIEGKIKVAFAHTEKHARYDLSKVSTQATKTGNGWNLHGEKLIVLGAPMADRIVVSARTVAGISLFLVDRTAPGLTIRPYRTLDEVRAGDVVLSNVRVSGDALLGTDGHAPPVIEAVTDFAIALLCAEAVGAMKSANDATLEYLKTRKQFGVTIGTFQTLQHRMVDMMVSYEQAKSMACLACSKVDHATDVNDRARAVAAAKFRIAEACRHISQESIQLHGGMGMTEEMKISHTFRRLTMIAQQFGDADHHLARYGSLAE